MICLLQRVTQAKVDVNQITMGQIGPGLVVLIGFQPHDTADSIDKMVHKLRHYRLFADKDDKMNLNVQQVNGDLLLVPQFTLAADTQKGLRPSFSSAAKPELAALWFAEFILKMRAHPGLVETGQFGADMQVSLTNDGPVTFWLET
jgi:D-tyrosyl-tRNA(Tyr) deacylase